MGRGNIIAENIALFTTADNIVLSRYYPKCLVDRPEIKLVLTLFFSLILQVKCGAWRAKEKEASLSSTKDEEERYFEHHNLFIVKLGLISLKQGHICRYGQSQPTEGVVLGSSTRRGH